jgi:excinuclease ABC subunit C
MVDYRNKIVKSLPKSPGVYQFFNSEGKIIYIGKAKNLFNRVSSYFNKEKYDTFKTNVLAKQVVNIQVTIVDNESDALLLENNLIKKYQPKYNILLKDDKTFPWICIKNEPFPRVFSTRKIIKDGSKYFGPYTSGLMVNTLLGLVKQIFQLRTCSYNLNYENINKGKIKKCLEYHIGNCKAPCERMQSESDYLVGIEQIADILKGNISDVINYLKNLMNLLSDELKFEEANKIKQKILLLEHYKSKSTIVNTKLDNIDIFSFLANEKSAFVNFLKVSNGAIVQSHSVELIKKLDELPSDLLMFAIIDIRERVNSNSKEIVVPFLPGEELPGIKFNIPSQGDKRKLLELSERNAKHFMLLKQKISETKNFQSRTNELLEKVKSDLKLNKIPFHIECFDNSNIQGTNPVAACVVFKNGKPSKHDYRHFNIKTVEGPNDFDSMKEVVFRRYKRLLEESKELPQLIIIDGGKGQLNAAVESLKELNLYGEIGILGIAKRLEEIYFPYDKVPLFLNKNSYTLKLLQNIRNEAHRFGISFHRNKRSKKMLDNQLDHIKGIGQKTQEKLFKEFGSIENIKKQPLSELEKLIGGKLASVLFDNLK